MLPRGLTAVSLAAAITMGLLGCGGSDSPQPGDEDISPAAAGSRIVFTRIRAGGYDIYTMKPDGSDQKRLTRDAGNNAYPSWSPDRSRIVFISDRRGGDEIFKMKADGSGVTRLTNRTSDYSPSWSPNGRRIVFSSLRNTGRAGDLYVMQANGTGVARLTSSADDDCYPTWHPTEQRIVFLRVGPPPDFRHSLYERDLVTGKNRRIIGCGLRGSRPEYSPDGSKIAFSANRWGGAREICVVNPDGTGLQRITTCAADDGHPTWSPDGSKLVFHSDRTGRWQLWRRHERGTFTRLATNNAYDLWPVWSR